MSRVHFVDQGTEAWWTLRRGRPTASNFDKIITPGGKPSGQARKYMYKLIAERLLGESMEDRSPPGEWVEHGVRMEAEAIEKFKQSHPLVLERVGFVTTDDGRIGCSPDCLVKGSVEAVEIKCPAPWTQVGRLLDGMGEEYFPQVQGQLLVGEWKAVHFYSYHPRMPAFYKRTQRIEPYLRVMADLLHRFCDELDRETERARAMGIYAYAEQAESA